MVRRPGLKSLCSLGGRRNRWTRSRSGWLGVRHGDMRRRGRVMGAGAADLVDQVDQVGQRESEEPEEPAGLGLMHMHMEAPRQIVP